MTRSLSLALMVSVAAMVPASSIAERPDLHLATERLYQESDDPYGGTWSDEAMTEASVKIVRAHVEAGPDAGMRALGIALANAGEDRAERARIAFAYVIALPAAGTPFEDALPAWKVAVAEARAGLPRGRRLAMVLNDAAIVELEVRGVEVSAEAEARAEQALGIRLEVLGPGHAETLASVVALAEIRGQPERARGNAAVITDVDGLYRRLLLADPPKGEDDLTHWFISWGDFHARVGQPEKACAVIDVIAREADRLALSPEFGGFQIALTLRDEGHGAYVTPWFEEPDLSAGDFPKRRRCVAQ